MSDPFSDKHAKDKAKATKDAQDAAAKQVTAGIQQRLASQKKAADRPANWDIGTPWRKKFFELGY